ncbi:MAG: dihydrolipoamide acetyltransferase family protein, partial [Candidatus Thorarchaeota archaeon]
MVFEFKFADIGEGVSEGEILKWHVTPGQNVKKDQLIVEVMTEKVNVEIAAPVPGIIKELKFFEGDIVKVGQIMFAIEEDTLKTDSKAVKTNKSEGKSKSVEKDDSLFIASDRVKRQRKSDQDLQFSKQDTQQSKISDQQLINERPLASPAIRKEAREHGIDLRFVPGTGPGNRINRTDLENFLKNQAPSQANKISYRPVKPALTFVPKGSEKRIPIKGIRRAISEKMSKSKRTAAHFSYFDEFDMTSIEKLRLEAKKYAEMNQMNVKMTFLPFIIKAVTRSLMDHPSLNASMDEDKEEIVLKGYYNIGIAVDTENGLIVPVIKKADQLNLVGMTKQVNDLANRARENKLKPDEIQGGTYTVTNVGTFGSIMGTPIINQPQVGILALGAIRKVPAVIETSEGD